MFVKHKYEFKSEGDMNSIWFKIDFDDIKYEISFVDYIKQIISKKYGYFNKTDIKKCKFCIEHNCFSTE